MASHNHKKKHGLARVSSDFLWLYSYARNLPWPQCTTAHLLHVLCALQNLTRLLMIVTGLPQRTALTSFLCSPGSHQTSHFHKQQTHLGLNTQLPHPSCALQGFIRLLIVISNISPWPQRTASASFLYAPESHQTSHCHKQQTHLGLSTHLPHPSCAYQNLIRLLIIISNKLTLASMHSSRILLAHTRVSSDFLFS